MNISSGSANICSTNNTRYSITNSDIYINNETYPLLSPEIYIPDIFRAMNPCLTAINIPSTYFVYDTTTWTPGAPNQTLFDNNYVYTINLINPEMIKAILYSNTSVPLFPKYANMKYQLVNLKPFLYFLTNDSFNLADMVLLEQYFFYQGSGILLSMIIFMMQCFENFQNIYANKQNCAITISWEATSSIIIFPQNIERTYFTQIQGNIGYILFRNVMFYLQSPNNPLGSLCNIVIDVIRDILFMLKFMNNNFIPINMQQPNIPLNIMPYCYLKNYMFMDIQPYLLQYIQNEKDQSA
jgi:hypothetical protein